MARKRSFTQAQVKRAIAAAKNAGLRIVGIHPSGTIIVYDGSGPIEHALRCALGGPTEQPVDDKWTAVLGFGTAEPEQHPSISNQTPTTTIDWQERAEKWKEWVRGRPLGTLERKALAGLLQMKGHEPRHIKGAGPGTMERLGARGFARPIGDAKPDRFPMYEITEAGERHWQRLMQAADA